MPDPPSNEGEDKDEAEEDVIKETDEQLSNLAPVAGGDANLLDFINKFQG